MAANHNDLGDGGELRCDGIENRHKVGADNEHLRLCIVDDVFDLGCSEPPVDVDTDSVEQRRSEEHFKVLDPVLIEEGNSILIANTFRGHAASNLSTPRQQLAPAEVALVLDERRVIGALNAMNADDVRNRVDRHGTER